MKRASETKIKKRTEPRSSTNAVVICQPFASGATRISDGVIHNFSNDGAYIETPCEFKLGAILHLRVVHYPPMPLFLGAEELPRPNCLVEVKWRRELVDEDTTHYGLGLRYLD